MKKLIWVAFAGAAVIVSCKPKTVTTATETKTMTAAHLAQGQTIFENSCQKCHALPNPAKYSDERWVGLVNAMAPKAKLTTEQGELVYDYVTSKN